MARSRHTEDTSTIRRLLREAFAEQATLRRRVGNPQSSQDRYETQRSRVHAEHGSRRPKLQRYEGRRTVQVSHVLKLGCGLLPVARSRARSCFAVRSRANLDSHLVADISDSINLQAQTTCTPAGLTLWQALLKTKIATFGDLFIFPVGGRFKDVVTSHHACQGCPWR